MNQAEANISSHLTNPSPIGNQILAEGMRSLVKCARFGYYLVHAFAAATLILSAESYVNSRMGSVPCHKALYGQLWKTLPGWTSERSCPSESTGGLTLPSTVFAALYRGGACPPLERTRGLQPACAPYKRLGLCSTISSYWPSIASGMA